MATAPHLPITAAKDFSALAATWKSETRSFSNVTKRAIHPAYQQIIGMGESAVPLILDDLARNGPNDWYWALTAITGDNPITEDMAGDMEAMTEAWLRWGTTRHCFRGSIYGEVVYYMRRRK